MRILQKRPLPPDLEAKLDDWEARYLDKLDAGAEVPPYLLEQYRAKPVKNLIIVETCGKCAYCESKITHVYYGDVEHILPKAHFPRLRLRYRNLTFVCAVCNGNKGDDYDNTNPILDPYENDPKIHLLATGVLILHRPLDSKGEYTWRLLALNRPELIERRKERIESVHRLVESYERVSDGSLKKLLLEQLKQEAGECGEYSFVVGEYLRKDCGISV